MTEFELQPDTNLRPPLECRSHGTGIARSTHGLTKHERQLEKLAAAASVADDAARCRFPAGMASMQQPALQFSTPDEMFEDLCRQLREL